MSYFKHLFKLIVILLLDMNVITNGSLFEALLANGRMPDASSEELRAFLMNFIKNDWVQDERMTMRMYSTIESLGLCTI